MVDMSPNESHNSSVSGKTKNRAGVPSRELSSMTVAFFQNESVDWRSSWLVFKFPSFYISQHVAQCCLPFQFGRFPVAVDWFAEYSKARHDFVPVQVCTLQVSQHVWSANVALPPVQKTPVIKCYHVAWNSVTAPDQKRESWQYVKLFTLKSIKTLYWQL